MKNYKFDLLKREVEWVGKSPIEKPVTVPAWTPNHIRSARDWIGRCPVLEKFIDRYLK